jgi:tetratricopeptide (TPR) repeat protein
MTIQVREKTLEEIKNKLTSMTTSLNKINYIESALNNQGFSFDIKRFLYEQLAKMYGERKMYDRAAKALANKATLDVLFREKIDSYLSAAELFSRGGKIEEADQMFIVATREANEEQKGRIKLARKNIYSQLAKTLEGQGRRAAATKFYEKLLKMNIGEEEKTVIKQKLKTTYISLGLFREARLLEGV